MMPADPAARPCACTARVGRPRLNPTTATPQRAQPAATCRPGRPARHCQTSTTTCALRGAPGDGASHAQSLHASDALLRAEAALRRAPLAAISIEDLKRGIDPSAIEKEGFAGVRDRVKRFVDSMYYGDVFPPVGSLRISYARLLELMHQRVVKRIYLFADGKYAMVEVPVPGWASSYDAGQLFERGNPDVMYVPEQEEWAMEKWRYYCELPGDVWESGELMSLVKREMMVHRDARGRVPYENLRRQGEVTTELCVVDPSANSVFLSNFSGQLVPIFGIVALRGLVAVGDGVLRALGIEGKKDRQTEQAEMMTKSRAKSFNVDEEEAGKKGKEGLRGTLESMAGKKKARRTTGVTFADVAGVDHVMGDVEEVLRMIMRTDESYEKAGAKPFKGILLQGPPGTGKTLLAKAMAGESGVPFYSANGAEFVEMFQGVAAARIRNLFKQARKHRDRGAIVFIDEIDAIGKARGSGIQGDAGTQEREQGLMQLLVEMDGFRANDRVLVIAATNRVDVLDDALLRPGRFDRVIYMGNPRAADREQILRVHTRESKRENRRAKRFGDGSDAAMDEMLRRTAQLTAGFSGAQLANLLNEAAICSVRRAAREKRAAAASGNGAGAAGSDDAHTIQMEDILEALDKIRLGLPQSPIADSPAKARLARVQAARAVGFALCPGFPEPQNVSIRPRGGSVGRILFSPATSMGSEPTGIPKLDSLRETRLMGDFEYLARLLVPLYAGRAAEEVLYGPDFSSMATAQEVSVASDIADYLAASSTLHPDFKDSPVRAGMLLGGEADPATRGLATVFERRAVALQTEAFAAARKMIFERRAAIEKIAAELLSSRNEAIDGAALVDVLTDTPLDAVPLDEAKRTEAAVAAARRAAGAISVPDDVAEAVTGVVAAAGEERAAARKAATDRLLPELWQPIATRSGRGLMEHMGLRDEAKRAEATAAFATQEGAQFPPPPGGVDELRWQGSDYADWVGPLPEEIEAGGV